MPIRIELGPRDLEKGTIAVARRDRGPKEKEFPTMGDFVAQAAAILQSIQDSALARATQLRDAHTVKIDTKDEFYAFFTPKNAAKPELHGGFALSHWCGSPECETKIKEDLKVTIRCIPFDAEQENGACICGCGRPSGRRVIFAKSY